MATDIHNSTTTEPSLTSLVSGIINDALNLFKQELALARREMTDELNKTKQAVVSLGAGLAVTAFGAFFLTFMVVYLLNEEAGLRLWLSYLVVGGVLTAVGISLFFIGRTKAADINLVPRQTVQTMKENVQWIKNQT